MATTDVHPTRVDATEVLGRIEAIYRRLPDHLLPYVGSAFQGEGHEGDLRMMAVGINAYVSKADWPPQPGSLRAWFTHRSFRFQRAVVRSMATLAKGVSAPGTLFEGRTFEVDRCLFATNAVKTYLKAEEGKRADQLTANAFDPHDAQWREELQLLATAGVMPHVIVIFGSPFWEHASKAFHPQHASFAAPVGVAKFEAAWGDAPHRANRIQLEIGQDRRDLLLVRLRHPAGRSKAGSAKWLLERSAFRALLRR